jgi:predicted short-subunit dehydrogenase-like oxidoreductase (DUF2520 family)
MAAKPDIAIVGAGNLGSALAVELYRAGYRISEIVYRDSGSARRARRLAARVRSRAVRLPDAQLSAQVVWLCVPDSNIAECARELARSRDWRSQIALHPSGALTSDELRPLRRRGAAVAAAHPLMTFVRRSSPGLQGIPFAIEGDAAAVRAARQIVRALRGDSFPIHRTDKVLYHAWGAFASPLLIALLAMAERVAVAAGARSASTARKRMLPILQQTLRNYGALGPADAFSGPLVRGDVATIRRHLRALARLPAARDVYLALGRSALLTLPVRKRSELKAALQSGSRRG